MSRPQLEVADIIRSAGADFIEKNRSWLRWTRLRPCGPSPAVAPLPSAVISMSAPAADIVPPSPTTAVATGIAPSVRPVRGTLDRGASSELLPHALRPRRLHPAAATGCAGFAEQENHLRFATPGQRRNSAGNPRNPAHLRRNRFLQRAPHLEPETPAPSACPLCRSRRRTLPRSRPLDSIPPTLLPSHRRTAARVPRQVRRRPEFAFEHRQLHLAGELAPLTHPKFFAACLRPLFRKDWIVYSKPPSGEPEYVLQYLRRYTHRVAISNHRLLALVDGQLPFAGATLPTTIARK